jgi:F-type H+-transporting ATPase subunit delta
MAVVEELMGGKALNVSAALASFVVGIGRAAEMPEIVDRFVKLAAGERQHEVAEVRSAVPLDEGQRQRLAEALSQATGKQVEVKVIIDEKVLGGLVARIGDTVIDGTIRHRLEQLKETI